MKQLCFLFLVTMLVITSCTAPATPSPVISTQTPSPIPSMTATKEMIPTVTATATSGRLEISDIPGFEDWAVFNEPAVDVQSERGALLLTLKRRALWFMNQRGVLAYMSVGGDFQITADVHTAKRSDPNQAPGGDGTVQLGGLMARSGTAGGENYVFIVVGDDGNGLSVETKNTTNDFSEYNGPAWDSASASLRLCRSGQTFTLYKRHTGSEEPWTLADTFERPDLPEELQVGVNIYSNSAPDLQVRYENISIEPLASPEECESN